MAPRRAPSSHSPLYPSQGRALHVLRLLLWLTLVLPILEELRMLVTGLVRGQITGVDLIKWLLAWLVFLPIAVYLARRPVEKFIQAVYAVPEGQGKSLLRSAKQSLYPLLTVGEGGSFIVVEGGDETTLFHIGGPGRLSLYNDTAAVLERAGQFSRVVCGPGEVTLARFERFYQAMDLRPQHGAVTVKAMSKDGIPVMCHVEIEFQIAWNEASFTEERPYPASPEAVFEAAAATRVRHEKDHTVTPRDWVELVVEGSIGGTLRTLLAQKPLDQLVPAQITSPTPESFPGDVEPNDQHRALQNELARQLASQLQPLGVMLNRVHLGNINVEEEVATQWTDIWRAGWRKWAMELLGEGRAERLQYLDQIRAETQVEFLNAVAREIQQLDNAGMPISDSLIALQFIDALRQMERPLMKQDKLQLPGQMWNALEQLRQIVVHRDNDSEVRSLI